MESAKGKRSMQFGKFGDLVNFYHSGMEILKNGSVFESVSLVRDK